MSLTSLLLHYLISNLRIFCLSVTQNLDKPLMDSPWSPDVPPCTRPWSTLYQTLAHLVPDLGTPCTRPWNTLYQTLEHLAPDPGTPCTRPCHTLYQTLPVHREQGAGRSPAPCEFIVKMSICDSEIHCKCHFYSVFLNARSTFEQ